MGFDLHSKQVSIAIILGTLAVCAFFLAQGTTDLLATWLLPVEVTPVHVNVHGDELTALPGSKPPDIHAMLKRNIFDPSTGPLWPPKPDEIASPALEGVDDTQHLAPGEMPPPCDGSTRMVASVYSPDTPEWSFVTLASGSGPPLLYRAGNEVDGKQVDSVYPRAVFLRSGSSLCSLTLFDDDKEAAPKRVSTVPARVRRRASRRVDQDDFDKHIRRLSDTKYSVDRELVEKVLANQAQLMRSARVVPHEQNGEVVGVKLYGIRRKSILGELGLQNGDLLRNINGYAMGNPNSALEAYTRLRSADALSLGLTRRGQPVTIEYEIGE